MVRLSTAHEPIRAAAAEERDRARSNAGGDQRQRNERDRAEANLAARESADDEHPVATAGSTPAPASSRVTIVTTEPDRAARPHSPDGIAATVVRAATGSPRAVGLAAAVIIAISFAMVVIWRGRSR
jgi:hypothetical protein